MTAPELVEILLVEDNFRDAEMTMRALREKNLANHVHLATDGEEALQFIFGEGAFATRSADHPPKVILLDLKLPKVDGFEVLTKLRGDERTKHIPVVVLTSSAEERDVVESYNHGVNSYIVKPVDFEGFATAIAQLGLYWTVLNRVPK